jgi:uncharacterized membrane protein (GlpM family)
MPMLSVSFIGILLRFILGGTAVAVASLIAKRVGGVFGGIFAAFPVVFLAALLTIRWDHSGYDLIRQSIVLSQGALIGMAINIVCALAAGVLVARQGWKRGLTLSVLGWFMVSLSISYMMFMV